MKYIAYCRRSTDEKDRQVLSIEAQVAEIKEYAKREQVDIAEFITESRTAKEPGRPLFADLIAKIERGQASGIIAWHPDRLARNSIDGGQIIYLIDIGKLAGLKFPTFWFDNTPQGKFMLSIAFGQSKYYVDNLSENVKRGIRQKLRNGVWPHNAPLGYLNDLKVHSILVDPKTAPLVQKSFERFVSRTVSFTDLARMFADHGIYRKSGRTIHINTVRNMLANRFYIGQMVHLGEYYDGTHEQIINRDLFYKVQTELMRIERPHFKGHHFPFVGIARCGECGGAITGEVHTKYYRTTRGKVTYTYYRCTKKFGPCFSKYLTDSEFEKQIRALIASVGFPLKWEDEWRQKFITDSESEKTGAENRRQVLELKLADINRKLDLLLDGLLDQTIDQETYRKKKNTFSEIKHQTEEEKKDSLSGKNKRLELMNEFIDSAFQAHKIARADNACEDLAIFAKRIGSNFFLKDRRLSAVFREPFQTLCATRPAQSRQTDAASISLSAGPRGVEPRSEVLETPILPLNYGPSESNYTRNEMKTMVY